MKIILLTIGKTKKGFVAEGIREYYSRIKHYIDFEIIETSEVKHSGKLPEPELIKRESLLVMKYIQSGDYIILLDERGEMMTSVKLSELLQKLTGSSFNRLVFIIGGAFGFNEVLYKQASLLLSLSRMTFSHQVARIIFLEQLYRAFTIIRGEPYHHG